MTRSRMNIVGARGVSLVTALVLAASALAACSKPYDAPVAPPAGPTPTPTSTPTPTPTPVAGVYEVRYYVLDSSCPYCRDLKAVIGGPADTAAAPGAPPTAAPADIPLAKVYDGRVRFTFRPGFDEHNNPNPEMEPFGFGGSAHGFAGFGPDGKLAFTSPGHHQSRAELVEMIDKMLR
ncbi:MAG: hypothetical protein K8T90_06015 [Planctomycetes bacterium]|nr:hypothetical protein [Planctomycetota bacterium]